MKTLHHLSSLALKGCNKFSPEPLLLWALWDFLHMRGAPALWSFLRLSSGWSLSGPCLYCAGDSRTENNIPVDQQWGFSHSILLSQDPTFSIAISYGVPTIRKTWTCWSESREKPWGWPERWRSSPVKTGWKSWMCSIWRREGSWETPQSSSALRGPI